MKKLISLLSILIIITAFFAVPSLAYEDGDTVTTLSSLINGKASQGSVYSETALGDIASSALLYVSGADAAIVCGGDLHAVLAAGDVTWADILAVFPDNKKVATCKVTSAQLFAMLEHGIGYVVIGEDEKTDKEASAFDGFPQVAGITMEYDVSAEPGKRIKYAYIGDRAVAKYDHQTVFTICATEEMLSGGFGYDAYDYEPMEEGLADCLARFLKEGEYTASTVSSRRMVTLGTVDTPLIPRGVLFMVGLFICLCCYISSKARRRAAPDRSLNSYIDPNR